MRSGFLLSCCGCVGGLVRTSVVVWPLVLVFVSRRCGVLPLLWLGCFRPRWFFSGGLLVDGRRPKNRAQLGISFAAVRQAGAWFGGTGMRDCMGFVEICLFVVLSIPLLVAYSVRVSFSLCHLEGIRWKYQCGTFDTSRSTRRHGEAVANCRQ